MASLRESKKLIQEEIITKYLAWGASGVSLVIWIGLADPINPIKISLILIIAAWVAGHIFHSAPKIIYQFPLMRVWITLLVLFLIFLIINVIKSDNFLISLIGQQGRWNGFLTYLALVIISLSAAIFANTDSIKNFLNSALAAGAILSAYGFLQSIDKDFISWVNQYNAVITTAGNPNFSAAIMAIFASLTFGGCLNNKYNRRYRSICVVVTSCLIYVIFLTDARQGLLSVFLGMGISTLVWVHTRNRILGRVFALFAGITSLWAILGILQIGPLTSLLYKSSVSVRGYYFNAGIEMFKAHPWFGVGLDRYGSYFKEFRDVEYPLKYGFAITSNNAHNVPIQFFATGGFFVGVLYITIMLLALIFGLRAIMDSSGSNKLAISTIFSAWAAYQAQSMVSIDSPAAAIWGWLLSGYLIGIYIKIKSGTNHLKFAGSIQSKGISKGFEQPLTSGILLIIVFVYSSLIIRGEYLMMQTSTLYYSKASSYFKSSAYQTINAPLMNTTYKFRSAEYLLDLGYQEEGIKELEKVLLFDSRNDEIMDVLAIAYFLRGYTDRAIHYRERITVVNPWDARNYLILGQLYKANGDFEKMSVVKSKIISFASTTEEGRRAIAELNS